MHAPAPGTAEALLVRNDSGPVRLTAPGVQVYPACKANAARGHAHFVAADLSLDQIAWTLHLSQGCQRDSKRNQDVPSIVTSKR